MITRYALWALPFELVGLVLAMQPSAMPPVPAPLRELPWAQLNFLHTTDTHGWHAGHLLEYATSPLSWLMQANGACVGLLTAPTGGIISPSPLD